MVYISDYFSSRSSVVKTPHKYLCQAGIEFTRPILETEVTTYLLISVEVRFTRSFLKAERLKENNTCDNCYFYYYY